MDSLEVENELAESKERFKMFFEHAAFIIHVIDAKTGSLILSNGLFRKNMGYSKQKGQLENSPSVPSKVTVSFPILHDIFVGLHSD